MLAMAALILMWPSKNEPNTICAIGKNTMVCKNLARALDSSDLSSSSYGKYIQKQRVTHVEDNGIAQVC